MKNEPDLSSACLQRATLDELIALLHRIYGVDISIYEETFLTKSIEKHRQATACNTTEAYLKRLAEDSAEAEAFSCSLHIVYSEFFRDPLAFALLRQTILPALLDQKEKSGQGELRVWSAGCAAGQEAWSVAILLDELARARASPFSWRIIATDLSLPELALARTGVYSAEAAGNVSLRHLREYFSRQGESYAIVPRLRARVDFSAYDLLDKSTISPPASIFGNFDLVMCSNVLLYYRPETRRFILDKVRRSLAAGGYLITDQTERQIVESADGFRTVAPPVAIFKKRLNHGWH